jgi:hypothetical protein
MHRTRRALVGALLALGAAAAARAEPEGGIAIGPASRIVCVGAAAGRAVLEAEDDFLTRLGPFDRAVRLASAEPVSPEAFRARVGDGAAEWTDDERARVLEAAAAVSPALLRLALPFPEQVLVVKTAPGTEGNAAFTRGAAIFLPERMTRRAGEPLERLLLHELFHVLSRANPHLRDRLYAAIGFVHTGEARLPPSLDARRITNPDAPVNAHAIRIEHGGVPFWAVPILFSESDVVDPQARGLFAAMRSKLLLVERVEDGPPVALLDRGSVRMIDHEAAGGFFDQVGRNTAYLIHPEEILADNFVLVVRGGTIRTPAVTERLRRLLARQEQP